MSRRPSAMQRRKRQTGESIEMKRIPIHSRRLERMLLFVPLTIVVWAAVACLLAPGQWGVFVNHLRDVHGNHLCLCL